MIAFTISTAISSSNNISIQKGDNRKQYFYKDYIHSYPMKSKGNVVAGGAEVHVRLPHSLLRVLKSCFPQILPKLANYFEALTVEIIRDQRCLLTSLRDFYETLLNDWGEFSNHYHVWRYPFLPPADFINKHCPWLFTSENILSPFSMKLQFQKRNKDPWGRLRRVIL